MKKTIFLSSIFLLSISVCSFSQKKHHPNHSHNYYTHNHNNFAGGFFAGLFFSEVFGLNSNSYRQMYFKYKPGQQTWRLARDVKKRGTGFYKRGKVVAKFHKATIAWKEPKGFKRHSFDVDGFLGDQPFWGRFWEAFFLSFCICSLNITILQNIAFSL